MKRNLLFLLSISALGFNLQATIQSEPTATEISALTALDPLQALKPALTTQAAVQAVEKAKREVKRTAQVLVDAALAIARQRAVGQKDTASLRANALQIIKDASNKPVEK